MKVQIKAGASLWYGAVCKLFLGRGSLVQQSVLVSRAHAVTMTYVFIFFHKHHQSNSTPFLDLSKFLSLANPTHYS